MNAPKFTPGPWQLEERKLNRFTGEPFETGEIVGPDHSEIIADIPDYRYDPADAERQTANARLIAAAQDLYGCLTAIAANWDAGNFGRDEYHVRMVRAALAKAVP